jgi:phage N-6-adenine-methyltransferase
LDFFWLRGLAALLPRSLGSFFNRFGASTDTAMNQSVHFLSQHLDWRTPRVLFDALHEEFRFTIDVCASDENALLDRYWTERDEALLRSWRGERVWMNPPYGRQLSRWMEKAWSEADAEVVVGLVPARTDTAWWHDYAMLADEIRFLRGRLEFSGHVKMNPASHNAPFPSAVVVWR